MNIDVVIGAGYGDEGKGRTVSSLATSESVIVRFNGGAQAGHTVVHNGTRHIFSHFGSGTLVGAKTHLSKFFVCHPGKFLSELEVLKYYNPVVSVSSDCYVTTPYDSAINTMLERARGDNRHGSVGLGFGETIERSELSILLNVGDLRFNRENVMSIAKEIRDYWFPQRCADLGLNPNDAGEVLSDTTLQGFVNACHIFSDYIIIDDRPTIELGEHLVFEGAQGLMLDQDIGAFPHVTRSNTGLRNVVKLINGKHPFTVYYVTRAYTTRHGAGPLLFELPKAPYMVKDETNLLGEWQGSLRFSYLNLDTLWSSIRKDISNGYDSDSMTVQGVMTCLDQVPEKVSCIHCGIVEEVSKAKLVELYSEIVGGEVEQVFTPETKTK